MQPSTRQREQNVLPSVCLPSNVRLSPQHVKAAQPFRSDRMQVWPASSDSIKQDGALWAVDRTICP